MPLEDSGEISEERRVRGGGRWVGAGARSPGHGRSLSTNQYSGTQNLRIPLSIAYISAIVYIYLRLFAYRLISMTVGDFSDFIDIGAMITRE
jgi:hypothetical protein